MENDFHNQINLSFESYQNNSVALETVIESLKEFWDKIVAFIKSIIEKIYNEDWVKDLNEQEQNEILNICFAKLKELILLLNNVQKFSSKCLHAYYTSCEKEISFYNHLITLNYL